MSDSESIKKMLRSVLQSSKNGVSVHNLQSEYRSLCGESIPLKKLGYSKLEDYLMSIPSVVRLDYCMGEMKCFAAVCRETAHIAELVARQKNPKKYGQSQFVNCKMRFKPSNPYMLNVRPRSSLRQPSFNDAFKWSAKRSHGGYRGFSAQGDYRNLDPRLSITTPIEHRQPPTQPAAKQWFNRKEMSQVKQPRETFTEKPPERESELSQTQSGLYDVELVQSRITQLLEKYNCGLWLSKLSGVYSERFGQKLHPQVLIDLEKWTHICLVERQQSSIRADCLIYAPLPPKSCVVPRSSTNTQQVAPTPIDSVITKTTTDQTSPPSRPYPVAKPRTLPPKVMAKHNFLFPSQPAAASSDKPLCSVALRSPALNPALAPQLPPRVNALNTPGGVRDGHSLPTSAPNHNLNAQPFASCSTPPLASSHQSSSEILPLLKISSPPSKPSAAVVSPEVLQKIQELVSKYSQGLWAHALPKLFMDTYKMPFPEHILDDLSVLLDICTVEYPMPHDTKKAILYNLTRADVEAANGKESQECKGQPLPSGLEVLGPVVPPYLVLPSEQYPSVLVTDAKSSNAVTVRYVGENYSNAQEAMEEKMHSFYTQGSTLKPLSKPVVGELVAVRGEDELARAQVMEVMAADKVKVYYVDYGFPVEISGDNLLQLHQDFLSLPLQAINVRLAGLEAFSSHPLVLSSLDKLAVGKILLMEALEPCQQGETPVAVLYDTSQDEDININSSCLKALQDVTMNNLLTVNATFQGVCVTNVCSDGTIYCQLPSKGTTSLSNLLKSMETFFSSQMTSESLVSRPFSGKFCLACHKGKWSRVQITNIHSNRVIEILFIDLGVTATVEVTDLREVPPLFLNLFTTIPSVAIKCCLADVPEGEWSPEAVIRVKEAVLGSEDCKMKISKLDQHKGDPLAHVYLFIGADTQELNKSINHQLATLWQKLTTQHNGSSRGGMDTGDEGLIALMEKLSFSSHVPNPITTQSLPDTSVVTGTQTLPMPPQIEFPQPGRNMDVFVPVACHPGYFVLQPWQDLHKLDVLMGEMLLYYNQTVGTNAVTHIQKGDIYAAKIEKNWHRVQVKRVLTCGLVSIFELDYGKHELVHTTLLRPLIEGFRQLPFQAITARLAGVMQRQWTEETSMLFRNHVEGRALVAQVESMSEVKGELWEHRMTVYLVDTTVKDKDLWIHGIMADLNSDLLLAA